METFRNPLAEFTFYRTYSRWMDDKGRRETWKETVKRYMYFMEERLGGKLNRAEYEEIRSYIEKMKVMPSMRLMWSAGEMAESTNVAAYNCAFIAPSRVGDFSEIIYLLMCGTGVGFSVESRTVGLLPDITPQDGTVDRYVITDSREGWADALDFGLSAWFSGGDVEFDFSKVRPAGSRLKKMGGRSSGPEPLRSLFEFSRNKVLSRQGKKLRPIDVHDIICKIGETIVMGGVRRSALISLSSLADREMRDAKIGKFWDTEPQRMLANNSAVYDEKPTKEAFLSEWASLRNSGTGERGIFNRGSVLRQMPDRRQQNSDKETIFGTNPCGEIILRSKQFCNLTEIVARAEDTELDLLRKTRIATILGTYQSTLTDFPYLSEDWKKNCEEERLLGVSITGIWDCPQARNPNTLKMMSELAVAVNLEYAKRFGINPSAAITCVKPSGTVSQLVDSASGMHPRHSKYYIRRIRISSSDPLFKSLAKQGVGYSPEVGQTMENATTYVLEFPIKAPEGAVTKDDLSAIQQLEHWKSVKLCYTEHNPSVTISIGENEWDEVAEWVYENWDHIGGLSFLPRDNHVYEMAPYEEITEEEYNSMKEKELPIDFELLRQYEKEDQTEGSKELACVGGACSL